MPQHRPGRTVVDVALVLLLAAGPVVLAGCGGEDEGPSSAPRDAAVTDFCRQLEDAPGADATAGDYRDYAARLERTGTPSALEGDAREGFELFVGYLGGLEDDEVDTVKESDEPSDVFSGDDVAPVESFKQGYVATCTDGGDAGDPTSSATPTGGVLGGVGSAP